MEKILWIADCLQATGFGTVTFELCKRLSREYEVYIADPNYLGVEIDLWDFARLLSYTNTRAIRYYQTHLKPDITVVYGSMAHMNFYEEWRVPIPESRVVKYITIDIPRYPKSQIRLLQADMIVVPSEFSRKQLLDLGIESMVVYHGVDTSIFYPEEKDPSRPYFLYGTVSTNKYRKMIGRIVAAYSEVYKKTNSKLLFYCPPIDKEGYDIPSMLDIYNIPKDRAMFPDNLVDGVPLPRGEMHKVYRIMDALVYATSGEAFGLPFLEASASGIPIVSGDIPIARELLGDNFLAVPISDSIPMEWGEMVLVDIPRLGEAMLEIYSNQDLREKLSRRGVEIARRFTWDRSYSQFKEVLRKL